MSPQLQNWQNFCQYHAGNWHGIWTRYSPSGEVIKSFQCIRSLQVKEDGNKIEHQNQYIYENGKQEIKTFGPYQEPNVKALFLNNSFSWGSRQIEAGTKFAFETGFRYQNRRASLGVLYNESQELEGITVIPEHLDSWTKTPSVPLQTQESCKGWQGQAQSITPDYIVSPSVAIEWKQLKELDTNNLTWHLNDGISVNFPQQIESGKDFVLATDWQVNSHILHRGIRFYDKSVFTHFSLQI